MDKTLYIRYMHAPWLFQLIIWAISIDFDILNLD